MSAYLDGIPTHWGGKPIEKYTHPPPWLRNFYLKADFHSFPWRAFRRNPVPLGSDSLAHQPLWRHFSATYTQYFDWRWPQKREVVARKATTHPLGIRILFGWMQLCQFWHFFFVKQSGWKTIISEIFSGWYLIENSLISSSDAESIKYMRYNVCEKVCIGWECSQRTKTSGGFVLFAVRLLGGSHFVQFFFIDF